ncbi:TlpA family protein disulfide reductase [Paenalkalicoccus suaedae]|uniref:TlpA family protein disulfide reductase n=1 Tax=Paenalkalicoccus suaedae TaxID=2592382 RepID=A0A859FG09_9BACI|nr:TlpA disulfide reductase family protein [Paenalkalicoccus suaedae]QKS71770.1 TlpA family protein disulfide reductase [Paenalkalicoccus suaedae]
MKKRVFVIALLLTIAFVLHTYTWQEPLVPVSTGSGNSLPDTTLMTVNGEAIHIHEESFVFFFTTWCEYCHEQWQEVLKAEEELEDFRFTAINVSSAEYSKEDIGVFIDSLQDTNGHIVIDSNQEAEQLFAVKGVPTSFLINDQTVIRRDGLVTAEELRSFLRQ